MFIYFKAIMKRQDTNSLYSYSLFIPFIKMNNVKLNGFPYNDSLWY